MSASRIGAEGSGASGRELAASALLYLGVAFWWLHPLGQVMEDSLPNHFAAMPLVFPDLQLVVWALAWGARALVTQPLEIFDANIFYPMPDSLAFSEHFFGLLPLFAPVYWVTGNPVLSANMTIFAIFVLRGLSVQILLRRYTGPEAAILGALFFSFAPTADEGTVEFYVLATFGLVLAFFFIERLLASARFRDMVGLALVLSMQAATSVYLAFAAMFGAIAWTLPFLWFRRSAIDARRIMGILGAAVMAALILVPLHLPYLRLDQGSGLPDYLRAGGVNWTMSDWANLSSVRSFVVHGVPPIVWLFAVLSLVPRRRMPLAPTVAAILVALAGFVLSLGPQGRPFGIPTGSIYVFFAELIPGMSAARSPSRFLALCQIAIPLLAGLGIHFVLSLLGRWPRRIVALVIGGFYLGLLAPQDQPVRLVDRGADPGHVYSALAEVGDGRAVLEVPGASWLRAGDRMVGSTTHWHPIVDGYSGHPPESDDIIRTLARDLPSARALQRLVDSVDIGWIVVHRNQLREPARKRWRRAKLRGLQHMGRFGKGDLYRVDLPVRQDRRDLLISRTVTLAGNSREDLGDACPGRIELLSIKRKPSFPKLLQLKLRFHNFGPRAWPGLGAYTTGLVRLRICGAHAKVCGGKGIRLLADVPARGQFDQDIPWLTPGRWFSAPKELRIELFQQGGQNLEACGVEPLIVSAPPRIKRGRPAVANPPS